MASHWFHHEAAAESSNNYPGSYGDKKPEVDLTLKLGLPDDTNNNNTNMFNPVPMASVPDNYFPSINFNTSPYQVQGKSRYGSHGGRGGLYQYAMAGAGGSANAGFVNNFPMNTEGRIDYGSLNQLYEMANYQYPQNLMNPMSTGGVESMINNGGGSMMGLQAASFNNSSGYNPGTVAFPPPIANEYTLIDTPSRRNCNIEIHDSFLDGSSAAAADTRGARRERTRTYNEPTKRCSNYNCNTTDTPMWRRGPLGPKTLCNACGIKYRKEEEKRKAKEASRSSG